MKQHELRSLDHFSFMQLSLVTELNFLNCTCIEKPLFQKHCNAAQSLCDIIRLSREQMSQLQEKAEPDPLLQTLES